MNNPQSSRLCGAFERNQNSYLITWVFFSSKGKLHFGFADCKSDAKTRFKLHTNDVKSKDAEKIKNRFVDCRMMAEFDDIGSTFLNYISNSGQNDLIFCS